MTNCVFCDIIAGIGTATILERGPGYLIFEPLNPHAPGHVLVVPTDHVEDATSNPAITALMAAVAANYAYAREPWHDFNLLTSVGSFATQTVKHLHWHIIPRDAEDGLHHDWPWCREEETT